ncbi:metallophosphoesterase family protein [Spirosoma oryzicola]|uniref:metallophosphoesterase family protein n=1 Tax=Spirosoma oryzicola TaxID=2898794 RepID=UPI001E37B94C|nr:metallophosphoesterase [Spirosoma oryzicola]UHG89461.1 metallophosphoesterase [Spirosoma oryzicola]
MNRRNVLKSASLLPFLPALSPTPDSNTVARKRSVRFAYVGDTHITPEAKPMESVAKCLQHVQSQADKPAFILHGGDVIMDALKQDQSAVQKQWDAWHTVVKANNTLPIEYCIGNHDVWGFEQAKNDPMYGKKWAVDLMRIGGRYRSFDRNGWHFIILDSVQPTPDGKWYTGFIDPEQLEWLKGDLAKTDTKTPVLVLSHIPIFSPTAFFSEQNVKNGDWTIPGALVLSNTPELLKLFYQYPNVKTALSGHMHLLDRVDYNGVTYLCNGAVCGNWWKSDVYQQTKAGYALIDLYDDGSVERTYLHYS